MPVVEKQGAVDVIAVEGPLNQENVNSVQETVELCSAEGLPMVVLNMSDVPLMDSAGLELLLDLSDYVHQRGGNIKLAALAPLCRDILHITDVEEHFEVFDEVPTAVRSFVQ